MMAMTKHRYIICDVKTLNGEPIIEGTRTPVRAVVELWRQGLLLEEIPNHLPYLTLAQIFDALSYYGDHPIEINKYINDNKIPDELIDPLVR